MNSRWLAYFYVIITMAAWGSTYVVSKIILYLIPPFTILFLRSLVASAVLSLVLIKNGCDKIERKDYKYIFFIGSVGYFIGVGMQVLGTKLANASVSSLINATNPIFILLFAIPILKEKLTWVKIISAISAVTGTYIIIGGAKDMGMVAGVVVCILATMSWALSSVVSKHVMQKYDVLTLTTYSLVVATFFALPISLVELSSTQWTKIFDPRVVFSVLYMGSVCTGLAYILWNKSLSVMEASTCSLFYPVQPMTSLILGSLFLGEEIKASFLIGATLIIGGVIFNVLMGKRTEPLLLKESM